MTVSELDIAPRKSFIGRQPKPVQVEYVGEVMESDVVLLASERGEQKPIPLINGLRERHHALARCLARGMSPTEASAVTGYTLSRISILRNDQSFAELVAHYEQVKDFAFSDFHERAAAVAIDGLNIIADRMEEEPDKISTGQALEIVKALADRTGHAPIAKAVNMNIHTDLTAKLTAARNRVAQAKAVADAPLAIPPPSD